MLGRGDRGDLSLVLVSFNFSFILRFSHVFIGFIFDNTGFITFRLFILVITVFAFIDLITFRVFIAFIIFILVITFITFMFE